MAQIKKDAKIINMKIDKSIYSKLDQFCEETGLSKTAATEKILDQYLTDYLNQPEGIGCLRLAVSWNRGVSVKV